MRIMSYFAALPLVAALDCTAMPFWGVQHSAAVDTPIQSLRPGEFIWEGGVAPEGPVVVVC